MKIKLIIAKILYYLGITPIMLKLLLLFNKQSVRILNYHDTFIENTENFKKQIKFYKKYYEVIDFYVLKKFLKGQYKLKKPGLLITFDDGLKGNYISAVNILKPMEVGAIFFISPNNIGKKDYMTACQIKQILENNKFSIGSHTSNHHRMDEKDTQELLCYEVIESKKMLEKMFDITIESFCWCGGELNTYTKKAHNMIKENYKYSFMTNNKMVYKNEDEYWLQRTNIEDSWNQEVLYFQLSGLLDLKYINKRKIIDKRLNEGE